jgi:4-amino-4-deoxy-L-arabinose transferase-like glycosyltransferase
MAGADRTPSDRQVLALLTLAFVLLGLLFTVLVPMFSNFDEQTHLDRARYTARHPFESVGPSLRITFGSWAALQAVQGPTPLGADGPSQRAAYRAFSDYPGGNRPEEPCPGVCQNIQYGHPPAYYLLVAPITAVVEHQTFPRVDLALRAFDVLLVAPMIALTWWTAREVWPRSRRRPLAAAAVVALFAPLAYTSADVNNDALILVTIAVAIAIATRLVRRGGDVRWAGALGLVVTIGLLTKIEMVLAAPALGLVVLAAPAALGTRVRSAIAFAVLAAPGAAWWVHELAGGGPLTPKDSQLLGPPIPGPWSHQSYLTYAAQKLPTLVGRFFGTYNVPVTYLARPVQLALGLVVVALGVAWLVLRRWRRPQWSDLGWLLLAGVPASLALGTLYASVDGYRYTGKLRGLAPRYLYPAAPLLAIGAVAALAVLARRWSRSWRWAAPAGMAVLALAAGLSVLRCIQGAFGTSSWAVIAHRARAVSPIGRPMEVALALGVLWLAALGATAWRLSAVD